MKIEPAAGGEGADTTKYAYDDLGNLMSVTLPNNTKIEYIIDGQNRRIGRKVNGIVTNRWLYSGQLHPVAEVDSAGNILATYYGSYLKKGDTSYSIIRDYLGSVRFIINSATGEIVQRMDYDEYGNVLLDSNPGFQPFGYAGGLYDSRTKLVRFGARDYCLEIGRWTTKDPPGFISGLNLYCYCLNDPINLFDESGYDWKDWHEVKGTLEGTTDQGLNSETAYGFDPDEDVFVALPDGRLDGENIEIEANGQTLTVPVGDIGPWNGGRGRSAKYNDPYWNNKCNNYRPQAESGKDLRGRNTNKAGIDLSEALRIKLGLKGNTRVRWRGL